VITGVDETDGGINQAKLASNKLQVANYVWDADALAWARATQASAVTGPNVAVSNFPAVQPVSGTVAVSGSVAVTGPLTNVELRASPVPVSLASTTITGTVAATQSGTWNIGSITTLPSIPAGSNNIGDVDVASIIGTGSIANAQVSVTSSSAQVVPARAGRRSLVIVNHGTTDVFLGTGTVTTANGLYLKGTSGASVSIPTSAAVNGIVASGTQTISYMEVF